MCWFFFNVIYNKFLFIILLFYNVKFVMWVYFSIGEIKRILDFLGLIYMWY